MIITCAAEVLLVYILIGGLCVADEEGNEVKEYFVDEGGNLTLPCLDNDREERVELLTDKTYWIHEGKTVDSTVLDDDSLFLEHLRREDAGVYKCANVQGDDVLNKMRVYVRTPPPRLVNVTVHPSTILALLRWDVLDTGGYPITHFTAQFRLKHSSPDQPPDNWHKVIPNRISPTASQIDVYKLEPNSTYIFEVWASNELGEGEVVQVEGTTHHDSEEIGSMCRTPKQNNRRQCDIVLRQNEEKAAERSIVPVIDRKLGKHLLEGVETFDTRYWVAAVAVVMGTLVILAVGTIYALYRECRLPLIITDDQEIMELVPNIILNPGYHGEWVDPDENCNDYRTTRLNNNTVVRPFRV